MNIKPGAEHEELRVIGLARQNVYQARPIAINSSAPYLVLFM